MKFVLKGLHQVLWSKIKLVCVCKIDEMMKIGVVMELRIVAGRWIVKVRVKLGLVCSRLLFD